MKLLAVHPSGLMYTGVLLRLEPLDLELVAAAAQRAGHDVRICDLQAEPVASFHRALADFRPDCVGFSGNYLANIAEIVDLAKVVKARLPGCFVFAGGHSLSFTADEVLEHGEGAIDCVLPTALPLSEFYAELVNAQRVINRKHFGPRVLRDVRDLTIRRDATRPPRGPTNPCLHRHARLHR
jgi:B12 binding domain